MCDYDLVYWINMEFAITAIGSTEFRQKNLMQPFLFRDAETASHAKSIVDKEAFGNIIFEKSFHNGFLSLCEVIGKVLALTAHENSKFREIMKKEINQRIARRYFSRNTLVPPFVLQLLRKLDLIMRKKRKRTVIKHDHSIRRVSQFLSVK